MSARPLSKQIMACDLTSEPVIFFQISLCKFDIEVNIKVYFLFLSIQQGEFEDYPKYRAEFIDT